MGNMKIFFDSSALIKYFLEEEGTKAIQDFINVHSELNESQFITSAITYAEVMATFRRARHDKRLNENEYQDVEKCFEEVWQCFIYPYFSKSLIKCSGRLSLNHTLTGADAFQLASALELGTDVFICSDDKLYNAAIDNNLLVWNPVNGDFETTQEKKQKNPQK